jgi:alanine dehydrogenase
VTILLTRTDLLRVLELDQALGVLRSGFTQAPLPGRRLTAPIHSPAATRGTATTLISQPLPGIPAYTVKTNAKFAHATPALRGMVCLHDASDGALLAVMDSATLTACRTGLSAAIATDLLAAPSASTVAVIGAGTQAESTLQGLLRIREVSRVTVFDSQVERAAAFALRWSERGHSTSVTRTPAHAAQLATIVLTATWSKRPVLHGGDVHGGHHVTALGFDEPGKQELAPDLIRRSRLYVDDLQTAAAHGVLTDPTIAAHVTAAPIADALSGDGRPSRAAEDITVYAPVGAPWQDLTIAWLAYQCAQQHGVGQLVDLLA